MTGYHLRERASKTHGGRRARRGPACTLNLARGYTGCGRAPSRTPALGGAILCRVSLSSCAEPDSIRVEGRAIEQPGAVRATQDRDVELRSGPGGVLGQKGQRQRLLHMIAIGPRGDAAHAAAVQ